MQNFSQTRNISLLADRMRPQKLEDFFGQSKLIGENSFLIKALKEKNTFFNFLGSAGK